MPKLPLKILYVEDETLVLFSVTEILRRRVDEVIPAINGEEGFELFQKHVPDVIITDINMPKMSGLDMARKIKLLKPDIHIFLLSAYAQPDYLLDAIDIGVKGFLKKPLDKEKLFSILQEISEPAILKKRIQKEATGRELAESALHESETRYQTIFNNLNDAIFVNEIDENNIPGRTIEVNDIASMYLGYSKDELLNMNLWDLMTDDAKKHFMPVLNDLIKNKHLTFEFELSTKDNDVIPVEISAHIFERNSRCYVISIIRDITERHEAAKGQQLHSYVLKNLHDNVIITDLKGNITYINDAVLNLLGYSKDQIIGKHLTVLGEGIEDSVSQNEIVERTLKDGQWQGVVTNFTSKGEKVYFDSHTWVMKDKDEKPLALVGISHDITNERLKEKELLESEKKFRTLAENIPGTVYIYEMCKDGKSRIMHYVGPGFREMIGEDFAKDINYDINLFFDHVHPDDFDKLQEAAEEALKNNAPLSFEYRMKSKKGHIIWVRSICRGSILENGNTLWQGVLVNVSDRKLDEEKIRKSEEHYRDLFENSRNILWISDLDGRLTNINWQFKEILGYEKKHLLGKSIHDIVQDKDKEKSKQNYESVAEGESVEYEVLVKTYCGKEKSIWVSLRPLYENDKLVAVQGFGNDITVRKAVVQQLRESENKYRSLYNSINDMIMLHGINDDGTLTNFIEVNDETANKLGYSKEELLKLTPDRIRIPPDLNYSKRKKNELLENHSILFETILKCKDGYTFPVEIHSRIVYFDDKKLVLAIARDISDRKEAEFQIRAKEEFSTALFEYNPVETIVVDKQGKIVRYNNSIELHRSRVPKIGDIMYKDFASKHKIDMFDEMMSCIQNNKMKVIPDTVYREGKAGEKHLHITIAPFPEGAIITSRDITRQVDAEEQLKREVEQKELLIKEINHRVKNNFSLVSSLLAIQQQNIEDEKVRDIFEEAQNRIQSIALVHKQLYSSENLADIDFSTYIKTLIRQLMGGFNHQSGNISVDVDIKDVKLDIAKAIPCGLIVNELITNAFKHGFKKDINGTITVKMDKKGKAEIELIVANDGVPFPDNVDFRNTQTLGLQLVTSLVQQIDGTIQLEKANGTKFTISFQN